MSAPRSSNALKSALGVGFLLACLTITAGSIHAATQPTGSTDPAVRNQPGVISLALEAASSPVVFSHAVAARDALGFPVGARRAGRHVQDTFEGVEYDEVDELDTSGRPTAIVAADGEGQTYAVAAPDGTVSRLQGAPTWPFTPLVGWIDADRLLVLNQGTDNVSRVAVVNSSDHSTQTLNALIDVRWFAISGDRTTVAAARESGIHIGPITAWLAGEYPAQILPLNRLQIVWDLALDRTGTHVAMLSGTEAADGTVVDIRELGYAKSSSGWELTCDAGVPFTRVLGQVWLG